MASRMTAKEAKNEVKQYKSSIERVKKYIDKNFNDMDFENANRREDMEEIIQKMIKDCVTTIDDMEKMDFEE